MPDGVNIFWFRRDLRLHDNAALFHALKKGLPVLPIFIFDRNILDELDNPKDARVEFILRSLQHLNDELVKMGSGLLVLTGKPAEVFRQLISDHEVQGVYTNNDYEPYARERDNQIESLLKDAGITFHSYKDQVIFGKEEIVKDDGRPYTVFTPYSRKWKASLDEKKLESFPTEKHFHHFRKYKAAPLPTLSDLGFEETGIEFPAADWPEQMLQEYKEQRNYPGRPGTSRLSVHLRFGTISIRELARVAVNKSEAYLNELIWREFYQAILWHFPGVVSHSFKPEYDAIPWRNNEKEFELWCKGETGYPIVDAGMRELNATGYMHNRVRMIVASFLTKHLLIDWRWGEAYFASKLLDYELASNNGGWQWAAGCGCDAAPYFRIFNPYIQTKKFDPDFIYIRKWVPEWQELTYPPPVVEHEFARKRCLETYGKALKRAVS